MCLSIQSCEAKNSSIERRKEKDGALTLPSDKNVSEAQNLPMSIPLAPHKYQLVAVEFMLKTPNAVLMLDMGLGKTLITLCTIKIMLSQGLVNRVLVVAPPKVAKHTWSAEVKKWSEFSGLTVQALSGSPARRLKQLEKPAHIYTISSNSLKWLVDVLKGKKVFDMLVFDELSEYKNSQSQRSKEAYKLRKDVEYCYGLVGTPLSKSYLDLFGEYKLITKGATLGTSIVRYRDEYFYPIAKKGAIVFKWGLRTGADKQIRELIEPNTVVMSSEDYLELPDCNYIDYPVRLDKKMLTHYLDFEEKKVLPILNQTGNVMAMLDGKTAGGLHMKLRQFANGFVYNVLETELGKVKGVTKELESGRKLIELHREKVEALGDIIESLGDSNALIVYNFEWDKEEILKAYGNVVEVLNDKNIAKWQKGEVKCGLVHPKGFAKGLNLQEGGNYVIWFTLPYSLEDYLQMNKRLYRQGQLASKVFIYHMYVEGTVDADVLRVLKQRDMAQECLFECLKERKRQRLLEVVGYDEDE